MKTNAPDLDQLLRDVEHDVYFETAASVASLETMVQALALARTNINEQNPPSEKMIRLVRHVETAIEKVEASRVKLSKFAQWMKWTYWPGDMEYRGIDKLTTPDGTLSPQESISVKILDESAAKEFFEEHRIGDVFKQAVHASTLRSVVRQLVEKGVEIPPDAIEYTCSTGVKLSK